MSDSPLPTQKDIDIKLDMGRPALEAVQDTFEMFFSAASVDAVYGEPIEHGEVMIIPSAELLGAAGFGMGSGAGGSTGGADKDEDPEAEETNEGGYGSGGGGGGGGRIFARPVAVIISGPDGVRVEPVVDVTKVALAFFTAIGFMAGMAMRMRRGR